MFGGWGGGLGPMLGRRGQGGWVYLQCHCRLHIASLTSSICHGIYWWYLQVSAMLASIGHMVFF